MVPAISSLVLQTSECGMTCESPEKKNLKTKVDLGCNFYVQAKMWVDHHCRTLQNVARLVKGKGAFYVNENISLLSQYIYVLLNWKEMCKILLLLNIIVSNF